MSGGVRERSGVSGSDGVRGIGKWWGKVSSEGHGEW